MSVLTLDHMTRLNLVALIGAQRANLEDMRLYWRMLDRIELSEEEKTQIGYQVRQANGQSQVAWDPSRWLDPRQMEFTSEEIQKLQKVIKEWNPGYQIAGDRIWLEPLLSQLEQSANGQPR